MWGFVKASGSAVSFFSKRIFHQVFAARRCRWWAVWKHSNRKPPYTQMRILHCKQIRRPKLFEKFTVAGPECSQWLHNTYPHTHSSNINKSCQPAKLRERQEHPASVGNKRQIYEDTHLQRPLCCFFRFQCPRPWLWHRYVGTCYSLFGG